MNTLITAHEVVLHGGLNKNFPTCSVRDIWQVEQVLRKDCLGPDFYDLLLSDLATHTYSDFDIANSYSTGDKVLYDGIIYECISNVTGILPTDERYWKLADKFNTTSYNELWAYLSRLIAYRVARTTVQPVITPITGQGAVKHDGQDFLPADRKDVHDFYNWLDARYSEVLEIMDNFVKEKKDAGSSEFDLLIEFRGIECESNECNRPYTTKYNVS